MWSTSRYLTENILKPQQAGLYIAWVAACFAKPKMSETCPKNGGIDSPIYSHSMKKTHMMSPWDFDGCWGALFSDKPTSTSRGNSLDEGVQMTIFTDLSCSVSNPSADFTPFQKKGVTGVPTNMVSDNGGFTYGLWPRVSLGKWYIFHPLNNSEAFPKFSCKDSFMKLPSTTVRHCWHDVGSLLRHLQGPGRYCRMSHSWFLPIASSARWSTSYINHRQWWISG